MGPRRQGSAQDTTETQATLRPWNLALTLQGGGDLGSQSNSGPQQGLSTAGPSPAWVLVLALWGCWDRGFRSPNYGSELLWSKYGRLSDCLLTILQGGELS